MSLLGFLNELSMPTDETATDEVRRQLSDLATVVRSICNLRKDFSFQTETPISKWRFNHEFGFKEFHQNGQTREFASFLLALINRSPMKNGLTEARETDDALEFQFNGQVSKALGLASLFDGITLSFNTLPWQSTIFNVQRVGLEEADDGTVGIVAKAVQVRNVSKEADVNFHRPWLEEVGKYPYVDFADFEASRSTRLSNIEFLQSALDQFRVIGVGHPWWRAVSERFDELQQAVVAWDPTTSSEPAWLSKVSGEGQQRKKLCFFTDLDNEKRCFDMHARFTPGAGRLHFRMDATNKRLIVAYIGEKIEDNSKNRKKF
ncbi:MAG: hypothetical protein LKE81_00020 [Acetobacter sp.]|jgi:hypothetical protein|uniref:hypothetical protein n=1 Tax=Acetobacter fabarum TaxID=483199 RepID=UPI0024319050|nr:hypothetical protein [Acetobacter fabarum]MCH4024819.1 hypothetical protein [Acetobacter fabarum]MCH4059830.1 hypothetical protein [Acetobacter sp.]